MKGEAMRRMLVVMAALAMFGGAGLMAQQATEKASESKIAKPEERREWNCYRVLYTLQELENGKVVNTRKLSLTVEEDAGRETRTKLTSRIPVAGKNPNEAPQYVNVSLDVQSWVISRNGVPHLRTFLSMNNLAPGETPQASGTVTRSLESETTSLVNLGKPVMIATVEDPVFSSRSYQLEATVTRMN